jgi:muramoyltetrapeptide carboxypeptidase
LSDAPRLPSVGFFAPSGYLPDPATMDRAAEFFTARGWRVSAGESVFSRERRFAGADELRLSDLHRMLVDPGIDLAICARGGYGISRLLGEIDFAAIAVGRRPIVGYSDFTAFSLALLARAGGTSFQGPAASDFAAAAQRQFTIEHFFGAIENPSYEVAFELAESPPAPRALDVRGRLWGGNLAMVCSLLGTPYMPRVRGGILFLEDVNEPAYRVERMMLQLAHAGVLSRQRAIVLGDFTQVAALPNDNGYALADAWEAVRERCEVPMIGGLPFGHGMQRVTLPVGANARLVVSRRRATLAFRGHANLAAPRRGDAR